MSWKLISGRISEMFVIHRIISRVANPATSRVTLQRCYCKPRSKRLVNDETSYKSVHNNNDERTNAESKQQEQNTNDDGKDRSTSSSDSGGQQNIDERNLMVRGNFENISQKNRETFLTMVKLFETRDVHRRNHVEFIRAALKVMREYGVHRDLAVYKQLIDIMPKGKMIPTNLFQAEFVHYPKQQQCIIDLLDQMEENGRCSTGESH